MVRPLQTQHILLLYFLTTTVTASRSMSRDSDITLFCCSSFKRSGDELHGTAGSDITLTYTLAKLRFQIFTIKYNGSRNIIDIAPNLMVTSRVRDPRFAFSDLIVGTNHQVVQFTLRNLSLLDNGRRFEYEYKDSKLRVETGENVLRVERALVADKSVGDSLLFPLTFTNLIVVCVVAIVVLLTATTLLLLCRKSVVTMVPCCKPSQHRYMIAQRHRLDDREPIYATPSTEPILVPRPPDQTEYAELGPGGGRLEKDKPPFVTPKKSVYAQVKTENANYPSADAIEYDNGRRTPESGKGKSGGGDYVDLVIVPCP